MTRDPADCKDMTELRAMIDTLDAEIVTLLALRQTCIDRAAVLKAEADLPARIPARVEEVVAKVRMRADSVGLDADLAERMWRLMIDTAISREERHLAGPSQAAPRG